MSSGRQLMNRLYYFTIEDESILAEAFAKFERDFLAIAYKVNGTEDVFVTTQTTKEAMDRHDVYTADECFLTGTAAEVIPVVECDGRPIGAGKPGPITKDLRNRFHALVRGEG